jgi:allantoate deiminase
MRLRQDALACAAEWISGVEKLARASLDRPGASELVATVGKIAVEPNAGNVIAGSVRVSLDIRSARDAAREDAVAELLDLAKEISARRLLRCETRTLMTQPAVPMDERLTAFLVDAMEAAGYPTRQLPSGAGHDAMVMATRVPSAMLFLRSPGGISHHPAEAVLEDDIEAALRVSWIFLQRLASLHSV